MSRTASTGVIRVQFVTTIASIAAPTVAELAAGVDVTPWMTRDGLDTPLDPSFVDTAGANSRHNSQNIGTYGGQPVTFTGLRDKVAANDTGWATFAQGTPGFLVVRRFGGATGKSDDAFVAAQKVEVWPIEVGTRAPLPIADNDPQKFKASMAVTSDPNLNATVAA